jgi:DNA-binding transcriptional LysR family regulator
MVMQPSAYDIVARPRRVRLVCSAAILGLGLVLAPTATAKAQDAQSACTPDVFRLCSRFIPNRGPIVACLIRSRAALSPACRAFFRGPTRVAKAKAAKSRKARRAKKVR